MACENLADVSVVVLVHQITNFDFNLLLLDGSFVPQSTEHARSLRCESSSRRLYVLRTFAVIPSNKSSEEGEWSRFPISPWPKE